MACRALGVSQAWFYKWRHGDVSLRRARRTTLDAAVAWLFRRRGGRDGSPPITAALHDLGWKISKNTVAASMRSQGLVARPKKKRRGLTEAPSDEEVMELLQAAARTAPMVGDDAAGTPRRTA